MEVILDVVRNFFFRAERDGDVVGGFRSFKYIFRIISNVSIVIQSACDGQKVRGGGDRKVSRVVVDRIAAVKLIFVLLFVHFVEKLWRRGRGGRKQGTGGGGGEVFTWARAKLVAQERARRGRWRL